MHNKTNLALVAKQLISTGWTQAETAKHLGVSRHQIYRAVRSTGMGAEAPIVDLPSPQVKKHYKVLESLEIHEVDVLILTDIHLPGTRYDWLDRVIKDAIHYGIKHCVIGGDLLDMSKLNRHEKEWKEGHDFEQEQDEANRIMQILLDNFDHVYFLRGNHDENFTRTLQWTMSFDRSMRMILNDISEEDHQRLTIVDSDHCYLHNSQGKWLVCHTRSYSKIPGKVPSDILMINPDLVGCIAGHRHHYGIVNTPNGRIAVEAGHFADDRQQSYKHQYTTTFPKWSTGGGVILFEEGPYLPMLAALPERFRK